MISNTTSPTDRGLARSAPVRVDYEARPMVYVVRFCGAQPSSIAVAIGQAISVLDNYLQQLGHPRSSRLIVAYRNHIEGAVTVQVGYPVSEEAAASISGEIFAGHTPAGVMVELFGEETLDQILAVGRSLPETAAAFTWQSFEEAEFRPWTGKLVESLLVPADFWPQVQTRSPPPKGGA